MENVSLNSKIKRDVIVFMIVNKVARSQNKIYFIPPIWAKRIDKECIEMFDTYKNLGVQHIDGVAFLAYHKQLADMKLIEQLKNDYIKRNMANNVQTIINDVPVTTKETAKLGVDKVKKEEEWNPDNIPEQKKINVLATISKIKEMTQKQREVQNLVDAKNEELKFGRIEIEMLKKGLHEYINGIK